MGVIETAAVKLSSQRRRYWIDGPTGGEDELKAWTIDVSDFIELVWKVEKVASGPAEAVQWLRRLYYCTPLGRAGKRFDEFIKTDPSRFSEPITSRDVPQSVLDLLVRVKDVRISWEQRPEYQLVDISHVFVLLDYQLNGPSPRGKAVNAAGLRNNVESMLSWAADVASAWAGFNKLRAAQKPNEELRFSSDAESWVESAIAGRFSRSDLLGDLDAVALSHQKLPKSRTPISDLLATYYQPGHSTTSEPRVAERIPLFLSRATPKIPHTVNGTGEISLSADARQKLYDIIKEAGTLLLSISENHPYMGVILIATGRGSLGQVGDEYLNSKWSQYAMRLISDRFYDFLSKGIIGVSQAWPADPIDSVPYYGYQGSIEVGPDGLPLLSDLEAMSQFFINWKTPNHALRTTDRILKPLKLVDAHGNEASIASGAHPGTARIRIERFVRLDDIVATPPNEELHADLLYLAADTNPARPSKKYKVLMVDQENATLTILGEPAFTGLSEWRVIRCPRIVLIDPWSARIGGNAAALVDNSDRPAIELDLPNPGANEFLSRINSNFDTIRLFADTPNLPIRTERRSQTYVITGVHSDQPILYLDQAPSFNGKAVPWGIPAGALDIIQSSPYQMTPKNDGCDHYDARAFIISDGTIRAAIRCSSYTSTRAPKPRIASIAGNKTLLFQSFLSTKDFINFSLMIYDFIDSTGKDAVKEAYFYFIKMTANRNPPPSNASFPEVAPNVDGKSLIRFHYGLPTGDGTGSEGCLVSPEYYSLRTTLAQLYNDQRLALGLNRDEKVAEIADSKTHAASKKLWQDQRAAALPDEWSHRLRGPLILVRPSQRSFINPA